jgi:hypothetical protein
LRYWTFGRGGRGEPGRKTTVHLLPVYDEYLVAYRDQQAVPRPPYVLGSFQHALVIGEQVAGTWRTIPGVKGFVVDVRPLRRLNAVERRALVQAVTRYQRFLGVPVSLSIT